MSRRTHKITASSGGGGGDKKTKAPGSGGKGGKGGDDDDDGIGEVDEDAARRMREKMKMVMNASSEFNIG